MKNKYFIAMIILLANYYALYGQDEAVGIYNRAVNSTVTIETTHGQGSGFFVADHIIATSLHVMKNTTSAYCYPANSTLAYEIDGFLAKDELADLVLLKVSELGMPPIKICRTEVTPGMKVYVIGSPKGLPCTLSDGIVSAVREEENLKVIQITAPVSEGSSGGPVMNSAGEVIGISTATMNDAQNLNFAVSGENLQQLIWSMDETIYPLYILSESTYYLSTNNTGDDVYYSSSSRNYQLSEISESYTDIIIVKAGSTIPEVGEKCFFYLIDRMSPTLIGYGTATNISGKRCTIELIESDKRIKPNNNVVILFESELDSM